LAGLIIVALTLSLGVLVTPAVFVVDVKGPGHDYRTKRRP
jgi:hypothetical protein